jgi:hypothetical protein
MNLIIFCIVLIGAVYFMITTKKKAPAGQPSEEPLAGNEKLIVWLLCLLGPVVSGAIFYYGWNKVLPKKAKQANKISWLAVGIWLVVIVAAGYFGLSFLKK